MIVGGGGVGGIGGVGDGGAAEEKHRGEEEGGEGKRKAECGEVGCLMGFHGVDFWGIGFAGLGLNLAD